MTPFIVVAIRQHSFTHPFTMQLHEMNKTIHKIIVLSLLLLVALVPIFGFAPTQRHIVSFGAGDCGRTRSNILHKVPVPRPRTLGTRYSYHHDCVRNIVNPTTSTSMRNKQDTFAMKMVQERGELQSVLAPASSSAERKNYDLIVVGSGNGACALLSECLKYAPDDYNILVLEEGESFYFVGDTTHENGWSKTYSSGKIFRLHNTQTPDGKPIISGRAVAMGGGGSINYTMIHESSSWLSKNVGKSNEYWDAMKCELNHKFERPDPFDKKNPDFVNEIERKAMEMDEKPFAPAKKAHNTAGNIPSLQDNWEEDNDKQLYLFPTQFNNFGQRTNSGVSLVDWTDRRIEIKCLHSVKGLDVDEGGTCKAVDAFDKVRNEKVSYAVKSGGKVVLSSGSSSPKLLKACKSINNESIGMHVKDHICMPLGIYFVAEDKKDLIGPTNNYESIFAVTSLKTGDDDDDRVVCTFDFFSGEIDRLAFLVSSLYLAYIPFNSVKRLLARFPFLFTILSNTIRILLIVVVFITNVLVGIKDVITFKGWGATQIKVTTSLLKFNPEVDGQYEYDKAEKITLGFFEDEKDTKIAEQAIEDNLAFLESLGSKPFLPLRWLFQLVTKIPYEKSEVKRYVRNFRKRTLLSEQHLAGGSLFGKVVDKGDGNGASTGKVIGTKNLHVADLSTVPCPRVSTQMTAYLIGHHVGKQIFKPKQT